MSTKPHKESGCAQMRLLPRLADPTRTIALDRRSALRDLAAELGLGEHHESTRQRMGGRFLRPDEHATLMAEWDRREPERREAKRQWERDYRKSHGRKRVAIVKRPYSVHLARAVESWRLMCLDPSETRSPREVWAYLLAASMVLRADEPMPADAPERLGRAELVALYGEQRATESDSETEAEREARMLRQRRKDERR